MANHDLNIKTLTSEISMSQLKIVSDAEKCDEVYIIQIYTCILCESICPMYPRHICYLLTTHFQLSQSSELPGYQSAYVQLNSHQKA